MPDALFLVCDYTGTTFTCWTVEMSVLLHLEHGFVDGCIDACTGRHDVVLVAIARVLRIFGCVRKSCLFIACPACLVACSDLYDKGTSLRIALFHMYISTI